MGTNLLQAIANIKKDGNTDLSKTLVMPKSSPSTVNRANSVGEALEFFTKDAFANVFKEKTAKSKNDAYSGAFSYLGNQNNPPDLMITGGDAVEIKKIDGLNFSDLALNSSYPKSKLHSDSPLITAACKNAEKWSTKDIIYAVGSVVEQDLKVLTFVYGDCYAASREIYEKVGNSVTEGLKKLDLELGDTQELGRVNRVDPLGITNLRIRGMWTIKHPLKVFSGIVDLDKQSGKFTMIALMRKEKYGSFQKKDKDAIEKDKSFTIKNVKIQEPNNPAKQAEAVLITWSKK